MDKKMWKPIFEHSHYEVSNMGDIRNNKTKKILKQSKSNGYFAVGVMINGKQKTMRIHRLVALSFIKNPDNLPQVCHKDGNRLNNFSENLKWGTSIDNESDKLIHGKRRFGSRCGHSKFNEEEIIKIRKEYKEIRGEIVYLAKKYNVAKSTMRAIIRKKTWNHV